MTVDDLLRLFAFPRNFCRAGLPAERFGELLGNSMVVSVMSALIRETLLAGGLVKRLFGAVVIRLFRQFDFSTKADLWAPQPRLCSLTPPLPSPIVFR